MKLKRKLTHMLAGAWLMGMVASTTVPAQAAQDVPADLVKERRELAVSMASDLWSYAELGYLEQKSSERLQKALKRNGFKVTAGIADIPTAFVATYGSGKPVIGIMAEFDALPGLSQAALPERSPVENNAPGHACGHHLFGSASVTAGIAIRDWLKKNRVEGTLKVFGTPAEEGGSGKVYLTRAGAFDDIDVMLHWHPGDRNSAGASSTTSNKSGRFQFHGIAAHAASAPERGRSALDGVEAMNYMVNMMREHVPSNSRIHYVITDGGDAPNIVPEFAEVYYYVRHPQAEMVKVLFERVVDAARAGALGTGVTMEYEVMHGNYPVLPNETLARRVDQHLRRLGGFEYDAAEMEFATTLHKTLIKPGLEPGSQRDVQPFVIRQGMGSTDVGDVSWTIPTVGFSTATWVPGTPAHSWQAVAAGGMSIGHKGMLLAAQLLAETAADLYQDQELIDAAWEEFDKRRGPDFSYEALLGDRLPPLDYRL
jgi:aminobenzoyl-glutamate utilization protein B